MAMFPMRFQSHFDLGSADAPWANVRVDEEVATGDKREAGLAGLGSEELSIYG